MIRIGEIFRQTEPEPPVEELPEPPVYEPDMGADRIVRPSRIRRADFDAWARPRRVMPETTGSWRVPADQVEKIPARLMEGALIDGIPAEPAHRKRRRRSYQEDY